MKPRTHYLHDSCRFVSAPNVRCGFILTRGNNETFTDSGSNPAARPVVKVTVRHANDGGDSSL